ncbi:MAG: hypothetical protein HYV27_01265 [Candidatus Hydrogenedentes bacterium]|nr:hypothetical protein [Candidatus Hydrogenedentota bacterium]
MPSARRILGFVLGLAVAVACVESPLAEPQVSLTVSGSVEEIRAILAFIESLDQGSIEIDADDPLKVRVHSVGSLESGDGEASAPAEAAPPPPSPPLAIAEPVLNPATAAAGVEVTVQAAVIDRDRAVDTLAATIAGTTFTVDLYDNGAGGDAVAGDGLWGAKFVVPADVPAGEHVLAVTAYAASGMPLRVAGEAGNPTTLSAKAALTVVK